MTGAKEPGPRGEREHKLLKPLRGECRAFSGVTVVTNARAFYTTRAAAGASGARHSLRPLFIRRRKIQDQPRANMRRDREAVFSVIARSESDEAIHSFFGVAGMDCFAVLAMTWRGLAARSEP
jgi:hypothetical protein